MDLNIIILMGLFVVVSIFFFLRLKLYIKYLHEKKFLVTGQQQKYVLEHLLTAISEFNDIPKEK